MSAVTDQITAPPATRTASVSSYSGAACLDIGDNLEVLVHLAGLNENGLCAANGPFSVGVSSLSLCLSSNVNSWIDQSAPDVASVITFCSSYLASTAKSSLLNSAQVASLQTFICCGDASGAKTIANCPSTSIPASICLAVGATVSPGVTSSTIIPSQTSPGSTATASQSNSHPPGSNTAVIVGSSIGAALAFLLMITIVAILTYRRQKRLKSKSAIYVEAGPGTEKAQLHGDGFKPHRMELPGHRLVSVKRVGGLEEMDSFDTEKSPLQELQANELVGEEVPGNSPGTESYGWSFKSERYN